MVMRKTAPWLIAALALLLTLAAWYQHRTRAPQDHGMLIAGGDGGGLPRAEAAAEGFDTVALEAAAALARKQGARALLVTRHEHLVYEQYAAGADADMLVDGGQFAKTLVMLSAGIAVAQNGMAVPAVERVEPASLAAAIAQASGLSYPQFLSRNLWQPLNAAPAQWYGATLHARASDWLRIAELLLQDGRFEGAQIVPGGWVQRLRKAPEASGAEPFAADDVQMLRGPGATRMWLVPHLDLAVLYVGDWSPGAAIDETRLPNTIIRALRDRQSPTGVSLNDLVPGH
jgi:CubicO group peptidase (beta-lactamase class C family)